MKLRPPRSTHTDTLLPYTALVRSLVVVWTNPLGGVDGALLQRRIDVPAGKLLRYDAELLHDAAGDAADAELQAVEIRSEEHTSELQSLMRISYAVFCLKKKPTHIKERNI